MGKIGCLIFSKGTTLVFFCFFFTFFFFNIISDLVRMKAQLFGMIVIGTLAIWLLNTTTGELVPTRINGIFDRLKRVKLMKDLPARGKRSAWSMPGLCLGKDEVCLHSPCCSPYACKTRLFFPKCLPQN